MHLNHPLPDPAADHSLPCGADLDELQAFGAPPPAHERCPHCLDAVDALHTLENLVRGALEQDERAQTSALWLTDRIMRTVRTELRPGPLLPMGEPDEDLWITHAAATRALRRAVDTLPGITAGSCRVTAVTADGERRPRGGRLPRGPVRIRLEIAISLGQVVAEVAAAARVVVADTAADCGMDVREIDIAVIDLIVTAPAGTREDKRSDGH
ncbi:hypothetical protein KGQ20_07690 [Catenulispora sp. NF23]|uniref:Asp23/Gls24 family envelope stress response protein n=1 Tax=Catenulispora pinistramenti TaxID=2705254 RepID=A0ABS5KNF9_9ACTN|nr:hypothetical protein [Catenulispora pinistramenti]MBS2532653.1 hypothetical protein [Catenulispora pinistramenti]MBS2547590.1 hypothetical protein [Catenulispora pinistramenti]